MHASAFWRKRHPHAAVREVENSGSHDPAEWTVRCYAEALCQLFNALLDGDGQGRPTRKPSAAGGRCFSPDRGSAAFGARRSLQRPCRHNHGRSESYNQQ